MEIAKIDRLYMQAAVRLAERGLFTVTRNNPRVGCLLVNRGAVVGRGWHQEDGGPHAEVNAIADAGSHAKGATAYVSLEPCPFKGRTPACTDALDNAGIVRVVIGARDPHGRVRGAGIERLEALGMQVKVMGLPVPGELNPGIYRRHREARPFVRLKIAASLDGRTAMADGSSQWITGESARRDGQYWRARSGAIVTGIGTVLDDDPRLTVREAAFKGCTPWRVVLDSQARFPHDARMLDEPGRIVVVCGRDAHGTTLPDRVETWHQTTTTIDIATVLRDLSKEGVNELLVEAGNRLTGSFVGSGLWDEAIVYFAPKFMGSTAKPMSNVQLDSMADTLNAEVVSLNQFDADWRVVLRRSVSSS